MQIHKPSALITGASSGIGLALAKEFAQFGYKTLVLVARNEQALKALADELQNLYGCQCIIVHQDLQVPHAAEAVFQKVKEHGVEINALVNNAGFGEFAQFIDTKLENNLAMMQLNMLTLVALTHLFLPDLRRNKGKILNIASVVSFLPGPYMATYYATKAFVLSFSEAMSQELKSLGITVTALCPGATQSGFVGRAAMSKSAIIKGKKLPTSESVAKLGFIAMQKGNRILVTGFLNKMIVFSTRLLPRCWVAEIVSFLSRPI